MSDIEQAVVESPPNVGDGAAVDNTAAKPVGPSPQGDVQQESPAAGKVEPVAATSRPDESRQKPAERRPSDFVLTRKIDRMMEYMKQLETKVVQSQNNPASSKPSESELNDDDFFKLGASEYLRRMIQKHLSEFKKEVPTIWQEHQQQIEIQKTDQEVQKLFDKYAKDNLLDRVAQILEENPKLNEYSKTDPLGAFDLIEKIMAGDEKKTGSPLAPKKSRMAPLGSGQPSGGSQNNGKHAFEELQAMKEEMQKDFSSQRHDPEFMKKWSWLKEQFASLRK